METVLGLLAVTVVPQPVKLNTSAAERNRDFVMVSFFKDTF
jgi:hypothetical protein